MNGCPQPVSRTRIKICGLTREEDVDAATAAGADAIGFVLYPPSPRAVSIERAAQLARRLPPFVTPVLLFVNEAPEQVQAACAQIPGAWAQFHGSETPKQCLRSTQNGAISFIRAAHIPLNGSFDLLEYATRYSQAAALLLDTQTPGWGGSGKTFNWSQLPPNVNCHLVLSGGLTPANVTHGILALRPRCRTLAVDVSSGVEHCGPDGLPVKGIKAAATIQRFIAAVRTADAMDAITPV